MMRAASMPHLGQITPTAVLGLRAIPSLLTRLDAASALTVRMILRVSKCPESVVKYVSLDRLIGRLRSAQSGPTKWNTTLNGPTFP
jgi:hypothetical protein